MGLVFPSLDSKQLAELVGILLGDGSISIYESIVAGKVKKKRVVKISLHSQDDLEYADYIDALIVSLFGVKPIRKFRSESNTLDLFVFKKDFVEFLINSVGLVLSPKWGRAVVPNSFSERDLAKWVLRGYLDTDGCVAIVNNNGRQYPRLEMKICPAPMQSQLVGFVRKFGFRAGVYSIGKGKVRVQLNGKKELEKWNALIGFSNPRKKRRAEIFLNKE